MVEPVDPADLDELFALYAELHLSSGRAASALRLAAHGNAPGGEMINRFQEEEDRTGRIWARIQEVRGL